MNGKRWWRFLTFFLATVTLTVLFSVVVSGQVPSKSSIETITPKRTHQAKQTPDSALTCPDPSPRTMPSGDAANDAAVRGQLFESIDLSGITDYAEGTAGVALADLNRDGRIDILTVYDSPHQMKMFLNQGCFRFTEHSFSIRDSEFDETDIGKASNIPNLVDFNGDGFLDIYLTRNRGSQNKPSLGNALLLTQGKFDVFIDRSREMGVRNVGAYSRQSSIGDVNGDGYLDIAVGADSIGNTRVGLPRQRLYRYQPAKSGVYEAGKFIDIGGTDLVPGFGGEFACDPHKDRAGPGILLRDLDNDGDLDLLQSYHLDMTGAKWDDPCAVGEYDHGVYVWRNLLRETGKFHFERVTDNGLAEQGKMKYDPKLGYYVVIKPALSLPYLNTADVDNDGRLDVILVGPTDPEWHVNTEPIAGRFWHNLGGFKFREATVASGLEALNWTYGQWEKFWGVKLAPTSEVQRITVAVSNQKPKAENLKTQDHQFYSSGTVFGDFNNDGWVDFVLLDRHEIDTAWGQLRNVLFLNQGNGSFKPIETEISGIDSNSVTAETADLNGDGLLDLYFGADPDNSYLIGNPPLPKDRFMDKVYWNKGTLGGKQNHWLRVSLVGLLDRQIVGARIYAYRSDGTSASKSAGWFTGAEGQKRLLGSRHLFSNHAYKSGGPLEVHFGLGKQEMVDIVVFLPDGSSRLFPNVKVDRQVALDLRTPTANSAAIISGSIT